MCAESSKPQHQNPPSMHATEAHRPSPHSRRIRTCAHAEITEGSFILHCNLHGPRNWVQVSDDWISEMCQILISTDNKIADLDLQGAHLSINGTKSICSLLQQSTTITSLDLSSNRWGTCPPFGANLSPCSSWSPRPQSPLRGRKGAA